MRSRSVVIPPPPDPPELDQLPPDPGPRWPDPPGPRTPPDFPPIIDGWIVGGDTGLSELLSELAATADPGGPDAAGSGSIGMDSLADLDRLLAEISWDRDEAERALFNADPPAWVAAPAGPDLAAALEGVRVSTASPAVLIELMKAATRMQAWAEATTVAAMAAFWRHREKEAAARAEDGDPYYDNDAARHDPMRGAAHEIAAALRLAPRTAHCHIDNAVRLTRDLPEAFTALRAGRITMTKARVILDTTEHLRVAHQRAVQNRVLERAPDQTRAQLGAACRRAAVAVDPDGENERHQNSKKCREITVRPLPDGMAVLNWIDSADIIQTAWIALNCLADAAKANAAAPTANAPNTSSSTASDSASADHRNTGSDRNANHNANRNANHSADHSAESRRSGTRAGSGETTGTASSAADSDGVGSSALSPADAVSEAAADEPSDGSDVEGDATPAPDRRTADQRRSDAAADLFRTLLDRGADWLERPFPAQHRRRPHVEILVPITVLLGIREDPCELAGYGPIPSDLARQIAAEGTWRRLLTDPATGIVLEASTSRHDPPAQVSETVLARDQTCRGVGCRMPARYCDRDHGIKFKESRRTHLGDLSAACRAHHLVKDDDTSGWTMRQGPDATIRWSAPTGHVYTTEAPALGPIAGTGPAHPRATLRRPPDDDPPPY